MCTVQDTDKTARRLANQWLLPLTVFAVTTSVYLLTAAYESVSGDVLTANVASWQLATTGSPYLDQISFPPLDDHPGRFIWVVELDNGREVIGRSPGAVAAAIPAYFLFGRGAFTIAPGAATAAVLTGLSVVLMFLALRSFMSDRSLMLATMVFALATPVWSVAANGMWPHTITVLGICGMAWAASTEKWWLVGLFGGVLLWGRLHGALIIAVVGILMSWRRRDPRVLLATAVPSGLMLGLQSVWTRWIYHSWNPAASYDTGPFQDFAAKHLIDPVNFLGLLVAPDRGILVWTPLILLLIPALVRSWEELPHWTVALFWGGLTYTVLQGVLNRFSGGDSFYGYRITLELLACGTPMFAYAARHMGRVAQGLFGPVLAVQTLVIAVGAINNGLGLPVDEVWTNHSFVDAATPLIVVLFLTVASLIGWLGQRIWTNPSLATGGTARSEST